MRRLRFWWICSCMLLLIPFTASAATTSVRPSAFCTDQVGKGLLTDGPKAFDEDPLTYGVFTAPSADFFERSLCFGGSTTQPKGISEGSTMHVEVERVSAGGQHFNVRAYNGTTMIGGIGGTGFADQLPVGAKKSFSVPLTGTQLTRIMVDFNIYNSSYRIYDIRIEVTPPGQVTGLSGSAEYRDVALTWGAVTGATQYQVERNGFIVATVTGTTHTESLPVGTYTYRVRAVNAVAPGDWSDSITLTTAEPPPPPPEPLTTSPTLVAAVTGRSVGLSWGAVAGADGYEVEMENPAEVRAVTNSPLIWSGLTAGTTYRLRIRAVNALGPGPWSDWITVTTEGVNMAPASGTAVNGSAGMLVAAKDGFGSLWPYALAVIAVVFLSFWVLRRTKKASSAAK